MEPQKEKNVRKENFFLEILKFTVIAVIIVVPIRTYIAQPFLVEGASMDPTFGDGQYLIVDELTYHFHEPKREDVIIFKYPPNPKVYFIKRVIGLPGETVSMNAGKITIANKEHPEGIVIDDSHIAEDRRTYETFNIKLSDKEYFVMGDNRSQSSDSRVWGPLERKYIVGRPIVRLLPFTKISAFPGKK